jgi:hypothetical protein
MFQIQKQRGRVLILVSIFIANNLIEKCHGQVTSCYSGETLTNNIGYTSTANCSGSGNFVWTACSKSNSYNNDFKLPSLSYQCTTRDSNICKQVDNCCYTDNCNKPPTEAIPLTRVNSCYEGKTFNGIGYLRPLTNSDLSNTLGEYRACVVK